MEGDVSDETLSVNVTSHEDRELLTKAQEIVELFQRAIHLGYSISFSPEQMKALLAICENGCLVKSKGVPVGK
jgi:hypothetical protein